MLKKTHSGAVRPERKSKGYFLFELLISVVMIAAIVVLAFPTYQDFTPEYHAVGQSAEHGNELIQGDEPKEPPQTAGQQPAGSENAAATEQAVVSAEETVNS